MPITLQNCAAIPLTQAEVEKLWNTTREHQQHDNDSITVRCVSIAEMQQLNQRYRGQNKPTNVLTFNYPAAADAAPEHDIALCLAVVQQEAADREMTPREYTALLVVHGFLHAVGLDHEQSAEAARLTRQAEQDILRQNNFPTANL